VKIWLIALFLVAPALAWSEPESKAEQKDEIEGWEAAAPRGADEPPINWVDSGHAYATDQAQALTEWMDNFFGDPNYDLEKAESLLRLEWSNSWDEQDDYNGKLRLRGKLQLPRVSKRLNLVFSGEDGNELSEDERSQEDRVGLLYTVAEKKRSRIDLGVGINSSGLRPGIRYRNQGPITDLYRYRFTQRVQWENDEGVYTTGQINLDRALSESSLVRWSNRVVYGEETEGAEWRTRLSLNQRRKPLRKKHQLAVSYFGTINGVTDPSYTKNYRLGVLLRRQVYRQFLFVELEPSYNWRQKNIEDKREGVWAVELRFEIALERDLRRMRKADRDEDRVGEN
jgi:hypothetical protein